MSEQISKVLVVNQDVSLAEAIHKILAKEGFRVFYLPDFYQACSRLKMEHFSLAIADLNQLELLGEKSRAETDWKLLEAVEKLKDDLKESPTRKISGNGSLSFTKEIRIHGRGGQGVVTAAELIAFSAFADGKFATAFPSFGSERMGAPVQSFVRISTLPIRDRSQIQNPDIVIIQDPTLIGTINLTGGLKPDGMVIIDTEKSSAEVELGFSGTILTIPASKIALEKIGRPIQNTTLVGALAGATGLISWESVAKSIRERFPEEIGEKNVASAWEAYQILLKNYFKQQNLHS